MQISDEEFIERNQLHMQEAPIDVECFLPPGHKLQDIKCVILTSTRGQQDFTLPLAEGVQKDISLTLPVLWNYARDGREKNYLKWRQKNRALANAHGRYARSYYAYCRDVYLRMQKLLGEQEFAKFIAIPYELEEFFDENA